MSGVAEEAAEFKREESFTGLARFRRFAEGAPLFEVREINGGRMKIEMVESGEMAAVSLDNVRYSIVAS